MPYIATLAMLLLAGAPSGSCSEPPQIASAVVGVHEPIEKQSSYDLAEIRTMAQKSGLPLRHDALGFYVGSLGHEISIDTERRTSKDGYQCGYVTTVTIRLSLINRLIEVARDLDSHGCRPEAVLQHYRKHATADDLVLSRYVQSVTQALREAWPLMATKLGQFGNNDGPGLQRLVQVILGRTIQNYDSARLKALAAVDNPQEIESLACGSQA